MPDPVAVNELYDGAARLQERRVGQIGGVDAYEYCCASHDLQLLLEGRCGIEFYHPHLYKAPKHAVGPPHEVGNPSRHYFWTAAEESQMTLRSWNLRAPGNPW